MKQHLLQTTVLPPGGFRAKCPHCGYLIAAPTYPDWVEWIEKHNKANGHPEWDYVTQLCENLPAGHCMMEDGSPGIGIQCQMGARDLLAGAKAVTAFVAQAALEATGIASMLGMKSVFVDQAEAERRAAICSRCPKNVSVEGCGGCATMSEAREILTRLKGDRSTSSDIHLRGCCVCGCSIPTIVHIRLDILAKGFTDDQRKFTETTTPWCWKLEA